MYSSRSRSDRTHAKKIGLIVKFSWEDVLNATILECCSSELSLQANIAFLKVSVVLVLRDLISNGWEFGRGKP